MAIVLTESAAGEIRRHIEQQKIEADTVLRIGVAGGGCSGLQYSLGFEKDFDPTVDAKYTQARRVAGHDQKNGVAPGRHHH